MSADDARAGPWIPPGAASSRLDRLLELRDRLLASRRFQRWAKAFPPTRAIARRRTRALFDLCAGFVYSQVLLACVQLKLFEILAEGPQTPAALSRRLQLAPDAAERLLRAAASLHLAERRRGARFGLGPLGAALLGNPAVTAMVEHHAALYPDLQDPVGLLRGEPRETALSQYWPYAVAPEPASLSGERVGAYSALMSASQGLVAEEILDAYPLNRHRLLLDVGGGEGAFVCAAGLRWGHLRLALFDLPAVAERAAARFAASGLGSSATASGGDFHRDPLPVGADLITLIRVVHDHDDGSALALLRAARRALAAGGTLLLAEPMAGTRGAEPIGDAYFGFYLLAMRSGRPRTADELRSLLHQAGFSRVRQIATRTPLLIGLLVAHSDGQL